MATTLLPDLESRAREALSSSPIHALRALRVRLDGERLRISGRVESFYYKQLAQEAVRAVSAGHPVENAVKVE